MKTVKLTDAQKAELLVLLWDYLTPSKVSEEIVITGWGGKSKAGLVASIEVILNES